MRRHSISSHPFHVLFSITIVLTAFLSTTAVQAQDVVVRLFQPPPNQLRISDLWRVEITNLSRESKQVYLQGIATESRDGQVVNAQSKAFTLAPGRLAVTGAQLEPIKVNQSNPKYRAIVTRTGTVPSGEYEICVFVRSASTGEELGSDCITQIVERVSPPILVSPPNETDVSEPLPIFTWTPPVPLPQSGTPVTYTLRIAEILGRQSAYDALQSNPAFFERTAIRTTTFQFPSSARSLQVNKRYAWKVVSYSNGVELGESEVWEFTRKNALQVLETGIANNIQLSVLTFKADRVVGGKGGSAALIANSKNSNGSSGGFLASGSLTSGGPSTLDAQAWTWGNNEYGQLGTGGVPATARSTPKLVDGLDHIRDIALGAEHGLAIELSGNVATWGNNDFGQLGLDNNTSQNTPKWVPAMVGVIDVAAGSYHSIALKNDGTVWTWGYNRSGELGLGDQTDRDKPFKVSLAGVVAVAAGDGHSLALKNDGTVWAWGTNRNGQADPRFEAAVIVASPHKVEGLSKVKGIAAGSNFSLALLEDGTVKAWGANNSGQLGNGDADADAKLINKFVKGQLTMNVEVDKGKFRVTSPPTSGKSSGVRTGSSGRVMTSAQSGIAKQLELGFVAVNFNGIVSVSTLTNVVAIDAGGAHAIALRSDSTVWTWGNNYWGTLGDGSRDIHTGPTRVTGINDAVSIAAGSDHSFAVHKNGSVSAWGSNLHKQLGMSSVPASASGSAGSDDEDYAISPATVPKN